MRLPTILTIALPLLPLTSAAETILGLYIYSRHGDRTPKSTPPTVLTPLGYSEIFASGTWFRNNYIANGSTSQIHGIADSVVKQSQITASAPLDGILFPSALGFLQGLYPPVGPTLGKQTLRNGTVVEVPLNGYQLIPVATVGSGTVNEDSAWLQGSGNCANAIVSSNNYFKSLEYKSLKDGTMGFYQSLEPVINSTFSANQTSFQNAYSIFDYLNVAEIHNATIASSDLVTNDTLFQLRTLADNHEFNLAYKHVPPTASCLPLFNLRSYYRSTLVFDLATDPIRAITGATIAAQVVEALNITVTGAGKAPLNIQFGAYGGMQSFFGLANLTQANPDFFGVPDYASTLTFELLTNAAPSPFPAPEDLSVRFLWHNGTTGNNSVPATYRLFGQQKITLPWTDFVAGMNKFAIGSQKDWCAACGNSTGVCSSGSPSSDGSGNGSSGGGGMSKAVAGVIGAMVTLAVLLGVEALLVLVAGLRLVSKKRLHAGAREGAVAPKG